MNKKEYIKYTFNVVVHALYKNMSSKINVLQKNKNLAKWYFHVYNYKPLT